MTISRRPGLNLRPSTIFSCGRIAQPAGPTPRNCTLASVPSAMVGRLTTCDSSGEASGLPSAPRAMPGRADTSGAWSRVMTELVSACEPARSRIAVVSSPVRSSVALKPSPIASIATSTPTTPAMPMTITLEAPQRCGSPARPIFVASRASRPLRVVYSHSAMAAAIASTANHGSAIQMPSPMASSSTMARLEKNPLSRFMS